MTECVIYCRVSTTEQADSGLGLEAQQQRCEAWAVAQGLTVAAVCVDRGASASNLDRPELKRAISLLNPNRVLVALRLDRLTRTVADYPELHEMIEATGGAWASICENFDTSSACGKLMLNLILAVSQYQREQIAENTANALAAKRTRGERLGATPYGYDTNADTKEVTVNADEMHAVELARALRVEGLTVRAIAKRLNEAGYRTKRGAEWATGNTGRLLNERYIERAQAGT